MKTWRWRVCEEVLESNAFSVGLIYVESLNHSPEFHLEVAVPQLEWLIPLLAVDVFQRSFVASSFCLRRQGISGKGHRYLKKNNNETKLDLAAQYVIRFTCYFGYFSKQSANPLEKG